MQQHQLKPCPSCSTAHIDGIAALARRKGPLNITTFQYNSDKRLVLNFFILNCGSKMAFSALVRKGFFNIHKIKFYLQSYLNCINNFNCTNSITKKGNIEMFSLPQLWMLWLGQVVQCWCYQV